MGNNGSSVFQPTQQSVQAMLEDAMLNQSQMNPKTRIIGEVVMKKYCSTFVEEFSACMQKTFNTQIAAGNVANVVMTKFLIEQDCKTQYASFLACFDDKNHYKEAAKRGANHPKCVDVKATARKCYDEHKGNLEKADVECQKLADDVIFCGMKAILEEP
jgi:hypothetical protein